MLSKNVIFSLPTHIIHSSICVNRYTIKLPCTIQGMPIKCSLGIHSSYLHETFIIKTLSILGLAGTYEFHCYSWAISCFSFEVFHFPLLTNYLGLVSCVRLISVDRISMGLRQDFFFFFVRLFWVVSLVVRVILFFITLIWEYFAFVTKIAFCRC